MKLFIYFNHVQNKILQSKGDIIAKDNLYHYLTEKKYTKYLTKKTFYYELT